MKKLSEAERMILDAAKREASRKQAFQDTVLEIGTEVDEEGFLRNVVSCKENGRWEDVDRWEIVVPNAEDEQNACDWDNPVEAKDGGLYDYNDGVITC